MESESKVLDRRNLLRLTTGALAGAAALELLTPERAEAQRWLMILRAGGDVSEFRDSDRLGGESLKGFTASIGAELQVNRDWGVEFNLAYVPKGGKEWAFNVGNETYHEFLVELKNT